MSTLETGKTNLSPDGKYLDIRVPMEFRTYGGRKLMIAPDGEVTEPEPAEPVTDEALVRALARAFRWRSMLESGKYATGRDLAAAQKINSSYVSRILRLPLLAPDIIEMILDGRQPETITMSSLKEPFPLVWREQRRKFALRAQPRR
jgi:hypothetical protein